MSGLHTPDDTSNELTEVLIKLATKLNSVILTHEVKSRPDGDFIVFEVAKLSPRFFAIINELNSSLEEGHPYKDRLSIRERKARPPEIFDMPEVHLLRRELGQSLTVHRGTFKDDFFSRYTSSLQNYEADITGNANFLVYGRRGAGKSSLLAYAMHTLSSLSRPYVWIAMQSYSSRAEIQAVCSILSEIFSQLYKIFPYSSEIGDLKSLTINMGEEEDSEQIEKKLNRYIPRMRGVISNIATPEKPITIFLDDLHLLDVSLQPVMLAVLYSLTRDNNIYIKASGIEALTKTWDSKRSLGLQSPHDIQIMRLDYNLTMPDRSSQHIEEILNGHAKYCGLPGISYLADAPAISRLVLAAAAVPRDALSLFSQAMNKSSVKRQKSVSVTSINSAASENIESKLKDLEQDIFFDRNEVKDILEEIKTFCISEQKNNAFLVRIDNSSRGYLLVQKLSALRFIHVLHEGITPNKAGERYVAMMLDFGFYVGIRAAKSVKLFLDEPKALLAKDLRRLPIFSPSR